MRHIYCLGWFFMLGLGFFPGLSASAIELVAMPHLPGIRCDTSALFIARADSINPVATRQIYIMLRKVILATSSSATGFGVDAVREAGMDKLNLALRLRLASFPVDLKCAQSAFPGKPVVPLNASAVEISFLRTENDVNIQGNGTLDLFSMEKWIGVSIERKGLFSSLLSNSIPNYLRSIVSGTLHWIVHDDTGEEHHLTSSFRLSSAEEDAIVSTLQSQLGQP